MIWKDLRGLPDTCFVFKGSFNIELPKIPSGSKSADLAILELSTVIFCCQHSFHYLYEYRERLFRRDPPTGARNMQTVCDIGKAVQ